MQAGKDRDQSLPELGSTLRTSQDVMGQDTTIFSDFVRSLEPGGEPPADGQFLALWAALKAVLASELKKRGLWETPPSYLGVCGWARWAEKSLETADGALDELLVDCYEFVFIRRLRSLKAQLKVKDNIDGLVFLGIRNFIYETQRRHDPLGYRVFELTQRAIRGLLAERRLVVLGGPAKVGNDTLLGFASPAKATHHVADFEELALRWNSELLPALIQAQRGSSEEVVARLSAHIGELAAGGVTEFRFRDLVEPIKNDARARWGAIWNTDQGETAFEDGDSEFRTVVQTVAPDLGMVAHDSFAKLDVQVVAAIADLQVRAKTRHYLETLWGFLRAFAAGETSSGGDTRARKDDGLPSQRKLAQVLGIPRERLPELFALLQQLVQRFQQASLAQPAVIEQGGTEHDIQRQGSQSSNPLSKRE